MMNPRTNFPASQENPLWISWHDTAWMSMLNPTNVMDYFMEKSNPFYDRTCNNEIVKMQRQSFEHLSNMVGVEYILLHVQDPILYVIRKQHRYSTTEATPMADYYIIAGTVYQAPDLLSVFNSRLLSATTHLQSAFDEANSYARYHPNKGYTWDYTMNKSLSEKFKAQVKKEPEKPKEEPSSMFQRQRVDMLLGELMRKFPLQQIVDTTANAGLAAPTLPASVAATSSTNQTTTTSSNFDMQQQTMLQTATTLPSNANGTVANNGNADSRPSKVQRLA